MTLAAAMLTLTISAAGPASAATAESRSIAAAPSSEPSTIAASLRGLGGFHVRSSPNLLTAAELSCADPRWQAMQELAIGATFHTEQTIDEWPNAHLLIPDYRERPRDDGFRAQVSTGGCSVEQAVIGSRKRR